MAEFSDYQWLVDDSVAAKHLARLAADQRPALQQLAGLRRELSAERARLVVEQADLRRRAASKFGEMATRMFFAPTLLEQATDSRVAGYKASRFSKLAPQGTIHDYCCGIGGDLLALAKYGASIGWDKSPEACLLATANLRVAGADASVQQADVAELVPTADDAWHVDPDRRAGGHRSTTVADHSPGPAVIEGWRRTSPSGAVKLAPGADPPAEWAAEAELEWITSQRECRQLVVWFGALAAAPGQRRATKISPSEANRLCVSSITGQPNAPCPASDQPLEYLFDPDPSVLASGLLGHLAAGEGLLSLGSGGAYLTGDRDAAHPLLQAFLIRECIPLRTAAIARCLSARHVGQVEIKKRGVTIDPEKLRRELKLRGDNATTVILTRIGKRQVALIADRVPESARGERAATDTVE